MYQLFGAVRSRALRVLWLLEELGVPYEHTPSPPQDPQVKKFNRTGKIPVFIDGGSALSDSVAIMTYLADQHGKFTAPAGTIRRANQDADLHFALEELDSLLWIASKHSFVLPEDQRVPEIKPSLKMEWETSMQRLADRLGDGPFLAGEEFTIADILVAHCLGWAIMAKFPIKDQILRDYLDRCRARPAFGRSVASLA